MQTLYVKKPFRFTYANPGHRGLPRERLFTHDPKSRDAVTAYEIEDGDPLLEHPWIVKDFADGRIESPAETIARLKADQEIAQKRIADSAAANARAEAALARVSNAHAAAAKASQESTLESGIATPRSDLVVGRGADLVKASEEDLNTPVNVLQEKQAETETLKLKKK